MFLFSHPDWSIWSGYAIRSAGSLLLHACNVMSTLHAFLILLLMRFACMLDAVLEMAEAFPCDECM